MIAPQQSPARDLLHRYEAVRSQTLAFSELLTAEDHCLQSMPDASPTKWHLAHTTWFFETFVLGPHAAGFRPFDPAYRYLFNSYYNAVGPQFPRAQRGMLTRPGLDRVRAYREQVDSAMAELLLEVQRAPELDALIRLGLEHEQQHQELAVTDIKHGLSLNPLRPAIVPPPKSAATAPRVAPRSFRRLPEGIYAIGHRGPEFSFDNEGPRHRVLLPSFQIAARPVTVGEYVEFVEAGGYRDPTPWLSDGWAFLVQHGIELPLYWERDRDGGLGHYTMAGYRELDPHEPVCHLSYFEADAYARWAGCRLPTEAEWEVACSSVPDEPPDMLDLDRLHPRPVSGESFFGGVWEWTASPYSPYPNYTPPQGAVGEYNGKFMCNQMVLRGGSCATPVGHIRPTYRNFFPASARWQFSGLRLAKS